MERNDSGQTDANGITGGASAGSTQKQDGNFDFAASSSGSDAGSQGMRDRAKNVVGGAGDRLADVGSSVRERAGSAKDKLATALEAGAERLRERAQGGSRATLAGATGDGTAPVGDGRVANASDRLAGGMESTAEWLRDADIDSLKSGVERQVKEHPGRTLLVAAGLGYLIGRAFRGNQ